MKKTSAQDDLKAFLMNLHSVIGDSVPDRNWSSEGERWIEFLTCILIEGAGLDETRARWLVAAMEGVDAMPSSKRGELTESESQLLASLLAKINLDESHASEAIRLIELAAKMVHSRWEGHIQRFLRDAGKRMMIELADSLTDAGMDRSDSKRAAALWLQNVANIPILSPSDPTLMAFMNSAGISERQLLDAVDELGMSATTVDDLIRAGAASGLLTFAKKPNRKAVRPAKKKQVRA